MHAFNRNKKRWLWLLLLLLLIPPALFIYRRAMPTDTRIVFVSMRTGGERIYAMDADGTGSVRLTGPPSTYDYYAAVSPDGKLIAFASDRNEKYEIYTMDSSGEHVRRVTFEAEIARHPCFSPDGRRLAYDIGRDYNCDICTIKVDGGGRKMLTTNRIRSRIFKQLGQPSSLAPLLGINGPQCDWWPSWGTNQ